MSLDAVSTDLAVQPSAASTVRQVWRLAWPAIAHMLLMTTVFTADRALVGHFSSDALASMQISTTLSWTACSLCGAVGIGATAVVARLWGAGDRRGAAAATRAALALAAAAGVGLALGVLLGGGGLLSALFPRASAAVLADAGAYLRILMPILPLALLESVAAACLHAAGDTRTPLRAAIVANLVNLAVSGTLVFGAFGLPALGVRGAAIGSAAAFVLQALLLLQALWAPASPLPMRARHLDLALHLGMLRRLARVALPSAGEKLAYHAGYVGYVAIIGMLGASAMAANQALISIEAFSYQTAEGFGIAAAALVGQALGARQRERAGAVVATAVALAATALTGFALLFVASPETLLGLFSSDPAVADAGVGALHVAAVAQPVMAVAVVASAALRGAGATRTVLWITLVSSVGVRLGATWLFAIERGMGLTGVWLGSTLDWLIHAALLLAVIGNGRWRRSGV